MNAIVADTKTRARNTAEDAEASTDLIVAEAQSNAVALFTDEKRYSDFYERVKESVSSFVPDLSTDRGRKEIASVAFKVTKAKTTLDKAGLALTEEWRKQTAAVNNARKKMTSELDQLAAEVRRPLTEWEEAEEERAERAQAELDSIRSAGRVDYDDNSTGVKQRINELNALSLDPELHGDRFGIAQAALADALASLHSAHERLLREEQDRAELERLRREQEERAAKEAAEQERREAAERAARLKAEAEARAKHEKEESDRRVREAEERAAREAEERARAEERRIADEQLAEERRQREAAEREAAESRRKEQERVAWENKERAEREAREADERHRKAVLRDIRDDLVAVGLPADQAKVAALSIGAGSIRHLTVNF